MSQKISEFTETTTLADDDVFVIVQDATGENRKIKKSNLVNAIGTSINLRTVEYTVGVPGVVGVDYNFTSVANTAEQSIELGLAIIPANSTPLFILAKCEIGLNGLATGTADMGSVSGGTEFMNAANIDDTEEYGQYTSGSGISYAEPTASSVFFSFTPNTNWNLLTTGSWKIWISYIDNSLL